MNCLLAILRWRNLRWAACAAVIPALWACGERRLATPTTGPASVSNQKFAQTINKKLDLLFMVDDSSSMQPLQVKMAARLPDFINALEDTNMNLPDLHVGIVSSSLGAGMWGTVPGCGPNYPGYDGGAFQQGPGGAHSGSCSALHAGENYLKNFDDNGVETHNYDGNLADVFSCMALLGDQGCGFESQLESVEYALTKASASAADDPDNGGFLRPDAVLAVVLFTNEDDCSVDASSLLIDPSVNSVTDPTGLGGLQSYRCNQFGHICDGQQLPLTPPASPITYTKCVSADDNGPTDDGNTYMKAERDPSGNTDPTHGHLMSVDFFTQFVQNLKGDPSKVFVAAIAGPPDAASGGKYVIDSFSNPSASPTGEMEPEVQHACTSPNTTPTQYADPAVRIKQWVDAFGEHGLFETLCADSYTPAMQAIATAINKQLSVSCVSNKIAKDANGNYDCLVTEVTTDTSTNPPMKNSTTLNLCPDGNNDCYQLTTDAKCTNGLLFDVCPGGACNTMTMPVSTVTKDATIACSLTPP